MSNRRSSLDSILTSNQQNYKDKKYFGIAEESFKGRLYNHNLSFRNEFYKNDTELSKELWQIKMKNYTPKITWRIIRKCPPYNYNSRKCYLCLNEKLEIALYEGENLLNKKTELISKCCHQNVHAIASWFQGLKMMPFLKKPLYCKFK